jgi:CHAD domain-containing protein
MDTQTLLRDTLNSRWDKYKSELKICRREFSEEAVHDFRVAARRLLSLLELLREILQDPGIKKARRVMKDQLDQLDELRNTQVLLADLSESIVDTPMLRSFQEYLQKKERKLLRTTRKEIKSMQTASVAKRIKQLEQAIGDLDLASLDTSLFSVVDEAFAIVMQRYALVDPSLPSTIHRVRLAFKKFRYMIEVIHPILQNFPADHLKNLHNYQSAMGDIQDMEVALQELLVFNEIAPVSYDPEPAHSYYKERLELVISNYIEDKGEILTFWRTAPDQPFPQEKRT